MFCLFLAEKLREKISINFISIWKVNNLRFSGVSKLKKVPLIDPPPPVDWTLPLPFLWKNSILFMFLSKSNFPIYNLEKVAKKYCTLEALEMDSFFLLKLCKKSMTDLFRFFFFFYFGHTLVKTIQLLVKLQTFQTNFKGRLQKKFFPRLYIEVALYRQGIQNEKSLFDVRFALYSEFTLTQLPLYTLGRH